MLTKVIQDYRNSSQMNRRTHRWTLVFSIHCAINTICTCVEWWNLYVYL